MLFVIGTVSPYLYLSCKNSERKSENECCSLVFILLDKPDELLDKRLSEHIMSLHASNGQPSPPGKRLCTVQVDKTSCRKFYLRLRDHNTSADGTPITARQLESLVRLAEARARRIDLREEISTQDALSPCLYDKYVGENGLVDFGRQQKEAKRFLSALNKQSELLQKDCFSISEIYSLRVPDVDNLNSVGCLLKKGPKTYYQVLSSSFSRSQSSRSTR
ncbi:hypothetical protein ACS0TY_027215 [Phlomoides rotata]